MPKNDEVNNPAHYTSGGIECIDAIKASMTEEQFKGYLKGNVIKYLWRYELKKQSSTGFEKSPMVRESFNPRKQTKVDTMQNQPYWDKTKREWVLEYKINDKDIGEYVQRVRFETLASANTYLQMLKQRKTK